MSWKTLEAQHPELAALGAERLNGKVAYLATLRADGAPRAHPMTPILGQDQLFVFMEPTLPKGHDLQRDLIGVDKAGSVLTRGSAHYETLPHNRLR